MAAIDPARLLASTVLPRLSYTGPECRTPYTVNSPSTEAVRSVSCCRYTCSLWSSGGASRSIASCGTVGTER